LLALAIDLGLGDPPNRFHPVVLMGNWLTLGRKNAPPRYRFWFGAGWILAGLALFTLPFHLLRRLNSQFPIHNSLFTIIISAVLLKSTLAYRNLRRAVGEIMAALSIDDLPEARRLLAWHLVSRDTGQLTEAEVVGAAVESLAENVTDSLVAPLSAFVVGGLPAAWAYRLVNTADAMWGYRTEEFEQLGKFAARLDDALNWLPARLAGWMFVAAAWVVGENAAQAAGTMLTQHGRTASPNAGWTMGATAGALEVTLSKREVYALEGGTQPLNAATVRRALRLADVCVALCVGVIGVAGYFWQRR
jgi:adenosylcobinamide-phosphate synthase